MQSLRRAEIRDKRAGDSGAPVGGVIDLNPDDGDSAMRHDDDRMIGNILSTFSPSDAIEQSAVFLLLDLDDALAQSVGRELGVLHAVPRFFTAQSPRYEQPLRLWLATLKTSWAIFALRREAVRASRPDLLDGVLPTPGFTRVTITNGGIRRDTWPRAEAQDA